MTSCLTGSRSGADFSPLQTSCSEVKKGAFSEGETSTYGGVRTQLTPEPGPLLEHAKERGCEWSVLGPDAEGSFLAFVKTQAFRASEDIITSGVLNFAQIKADTAGCAVCLSLSL